MLSHIALVWSGRCHASPDGMPEGAPSDRHARGVVAGGLWMVCGEWLVPVLRAPLAGVGGVDSDHADPGPELGLHPHHRPARLSCPARQASDLTIQVRLVIMRGQPRIPPERGRRRPRDTSSDTSTVPSFTRTAETGDVPSRNQRYAVCG